jgi:hypothetical protein
MYHLLFALVALIGLTPGSSQQPNRAGLAVYLVQAERPHGGMVYLDELVLEEPPYLIEDQIVSYDWNSHTINVIPGALKDQPEAQEFVVMVGELRLYRGYFTHYHSSRGYFGNPVVYLPYIPTPDGDTATLAGMENQFKIGIWGKEDGDPRFDKRLYDYLVSSGLLLNED